MIFLILFFFFVCSALLNKIYDFVLSIPINLRSHAYRKRDASKTFLRFVHSHDIVYHYYYYHYLFFTSNALEYIHCSRCIYPCSIAFELFFRRGFALKLTQNCSDDKRLSEFVMAPSHRAITRMMDDLVFAQPKQKCLSISILFLSIFTSNNDISCHFFFTLLSVRFIHPLP